MASAREMRLRIKSVKNISQVTRALEAVSAAKVRKAIQALTATRSYATKSWQVMTHITKSMDVAGVRERLIAQMAEVYKGNIFFGEDLMEIPIGGPAATNAPD